MTVHRVAVAGLSGLAVPGYALAHSPVEGIGTFYNGLLHPLLVPAHLLLLVAVGLFLGQQGARTVEPALGAFAVSTAAGLVASWCSMSAGTETAILALSAVVGLVVAMAPEVAMPWCSAITLLAGFLLGADSSQQALSGNDALVALLGSGIAICVLVLYPLALAEYLNRGTWQRIGTRIAGSWVAASSLLVLALSFSPRTVA